jgi:hypothetical protein
MLTKISIFSLLFSSYVLISAYIAYFWLHISEIGDCLLNGRMIALLRATLCSFFCLWISMPLIDPYPNIEMIIIIINIFQSTNRDINSDASTNRRSLLASFPMSEATSLLSAAEVCGVA